MECFHHNFISAPCGPFLHSCKLTKVLRVTFKLFLRAKSATKAHISYVMEHRKPHKVVTWDEATNARPPLRIDLDGPSMCSYSPNNKPLNETNSPVWSFGRRTYVEKGASRFHFFV